MFCMKKPPKYGLGQWYSTVVVSCCFFTTGLAMAWTSPAFVKVKRNETDMHWTLNEMSLIAALPFCGRFFSPIPMGYMMDWNGRRMCLIMGRVIQLAHWLMIYFSHNLWVIYVARVLNGWFSGMAFFVIPAYVGEISHHKIRGRAQVILNAQFILGTVIESFIGTFLSYDNLILTSLLIDTFLFIFMFFIPETPHHLIRKLKAKEAELTLRWLRGTEDVDREFNRISRNIKKQMSEKNTYMDILKTKASRKGFIIVQMLMMIQRLSGLTVLIPYGSFIMPDTAWLSNEQGATLLNLSYLVVCIASGFFVDSWGRKKFLILSSAGTCVFMIGCTVWFYMQQSPDWDVRGTEWIVILCLFMQAAFYSTGFFYIPTIIMSEIFALNIKAKANAVGAMTAVIVSMFIIFVFLPLTNAFGLYSNFIIYSMATFVGTIYAATIIETRGYSLEAIQAILAGTLPSDLSLGEAKLFAKDRRQSGTDDEDDPRRGSSGYR